MYDSTGSLRPEWAAIIFDSVADGVFTVDGDWRVTSFNRSAERITRISRTEVIGKFCCEVFRASICEGQCALRQTLATGRPVIDQSAYIVNADGNQIPISLSTALLRDENGTVVGGVETFRDLSEIADLRNELGRRYTFQDIISKSQTFQEIFDVLPRIAASESSVLIEGESGTGKELVARALHALSPRCHGPFIAVNCGALPDTLLESEFFGHTMGAFTGAVRDKPGRFRLARGGTIFLDEIGEISPALQVRLLRVLQDGTYEPLGSTSSETADVRVVTATNRQLGDRVKEGAFREDLYYRINVVRLALPPLRKRTEDIPLLVDHFITHFNRLRGRQIAGATPQALRLLMQHHFPGNVRELKNSIEYAFVVCDGRWITPEHLPIDLRERSCGQPFMTGPAATLEAMEQNLILDTLKRHNGNRTGAAKELGIHKSTLYRKLLRYGIPSGLAETAQDQN